MALDYGDARTGVAISDERGILCGETLVIAEWNEERLVNRIAALAADKGCALVLLGLPLNMDGSEGRARGKVPGPGGFAHSRRRAGGAAERRAAHER